MADKTNQTQPSKVPETASTSSVPSPNETLPTSKVSVGPTLGTKINRIFDKIGKFMTTTFWHIIGLVFILLAILLKTHHLVPMLVKPISHFPYIIAGIGLLFLGYARNMVRGEYVTAFQKDRQFLHRWKIPLLAGQVFILDTTGVYALLVGIHFLKPLQNIIILVFFLVVFSCYFLWYVMAHFINRIPSFSSLRVSVLALFLGVISFATWVYGQMILVSIIIGLFSIISVLVSLSIAVSSKTQMGSWPRFACLVATVILLLPVGFNAIVIGKPHTTLVGLGLAYKGIEGQVVESAYSQDGKKIAFCQKTTSGIFLQVVNSDDNSAIFKIPAGEGEFKLFFIENGKSILIDALKGTERQLWKIDSTNGAFVVLKAGIQSIEDGTPWSEKNRKFLFVTNPEGRYNLNTLDLTTGKVQVLYKSDNPIHTPSWNFAFDKVSFADGMSGLPYIFDVSSGLINPIISDVERPEITKLLKGPPVLEVLPAPDGFRYLYVTTQEKTYSFWEVRTNGTFREKIHETNGNIRHILWFPNGQKFLFEEKMRRNDFNSETENIEIVDANLGTVETLLPTQLSTDSPSISPDGIKVAFAGGSGLWFPSLNKLGIWVAVLR